MDRNSRRLSREQLPGARTAGERLPEAEANHVSRRREDHRGVLTPGMVSGHHRGGVLNSNCVPVYSLG